MDGSALERKKKRTPNSSTVPAFANSADIERRRMGILLLRYSHNPSAYTGSRMSAGQITAVRDWVWLLPW